MRTINTTLYYPSRSNVFTLYHLTDVHLGHMGCDERLLMATVDEIANNDFAYWGAGGDMIDAITRVGDPRYRESTMAPWMHGHNDIITCSIDRLRETLKPIAHKCLYSLKGNHEDALLQHQSNDAYARITKHLADDGGKSIKDLALGWEGFVTLTLRRGTPEAYGGSWKMTLYVHHGAGGDRKAGGHALRLEELLLTYDADLIMVGHRHVQQVVAKQTVGPSGHGVKIRQRVGMFCPSLLKSYLPEDEAGWPRDNYPQAKQLPPTEVGVAQVEIKPDVRHIVVPVGIALPEMRKAA